MSHTRLMQLAEISKNDYNVIVGSDIRECVTIALGYRKALQEAIDLLDSMRHVTNAQQLARIADLRAKL